MKLRKVATKSLCTSCLAVGQPYELNENTCLKDLSGVIQPTALLIEDTKCGIGKGENLIQCRPTSKPPSKGN